MESHYQRDIMIVNLQQASLRKSPNNSITWSRVAIREPRKIELRSILIPLPLLFLSGVAAGISIMLAIGT